MSATAFKVSPEMRMEVAGFKRTLPTTLSGDAIRLMVQVRDIAPLDKVADLFPHVVNKLAQLWKRPFHADRYFDDLVHDHRGGRIGFPLAVINEISALHNHYRTNVFPVPQDVWSSVYNSQLAR
jgi:hypothetical protein